MNDLTILKSVTMFRGIDNIQQNDPSIKLNVRNILHHNVSPTEHLIWIRVTLSKP